MKAINFNEGDFVTCTGSEIFEVINLNFDTDFAIFKCIYTQNNIYYVGKTEGYIVGRYDKITKDEYPELYKKTFELKKNKNEKQ